MEDMLPNMRHAACEPNPGRTSPTAAYSVEWRAPFADGWGTKAYCAPVLSGWDTFGDEPSVLISKRPKSPTRSPASAQQPRSPASPRTARVIKGSPRVASASLPFRTHSLPPRLAAIPIQRKGPHRVDIDTDVAMMPYDRPNVLKPPLNARTGGAAPWMNDNALLYVRRGGRPLGSGRLPRSQWRSLPSSSTPLAVEPLQTGTFNVTRLERDTATSSSAAAGGSPTARTGPGHNEEHAWTARLPKLEAFPPERVLSSPRQQQIIVYDDLDEDLKKVIKDTSLVRRALFAD